MIISLSDSLDASMWSIIISFVETTTSTTVKGGTSEAVDVKGIIKSVSDGIIAVIVVVLIAMFILVIILVFAILKAKGYNLYDILFAPSSDMVPVEGISKRIVPPGYTPRGPVAHKSTRHYKLNTLPKFSKSVKEKSTSVKKAEVSIRKMLLNKSNEG